MSLLNMRAFIIVDKHVQIDDEAFLLTFRLTLLKMSKHHSDISDKNSEKKKTF